MSGDVPSVNFTLNTIVGSSDAIDRVCSGMNRSGVTSSANTDSHVCPAELSSSALAVFVHTPTPGTSYALSSSGHEVYDGIPASNQVSANSGSVALVATTKAATNPLRMLQMTFSMAFSSFKPLKANPCPVELVA